MIEPSTEITVETVSRTDRSRRRVWWGRGLVLSAVVVAVGVFVASTAPRTQSTEWTGHRGPSGAVNLDSLIAFDDGFAMLSGMTGEGVVLWSSADGAQWTPQPLQGAPSQLSVLGGSLIAYDGLSGRMIERLGDEWVEGDPFPFPDNVRSRQGSGRPSVIGDDGAFLAVGLAGDVWLSEDGSVFDEVVPEPMWGPGVEQPFDSACRPRSRTSPDIPPLVFTDSGYLAMTSSNSSEPFGISPVCEPTIWHSENGSDWTQNGSPLQSGAFVYDLAWREGRFVAVGGLDIGDSAAWTSTDGLDWEMFSPGGSWGEVDLISVEAGRGGWIVVGTSSEGLGFAGWTSTEGVCWEALPVDVGGGDAVVATSQVMVVDRARYPELWVGSRLSADGSCR
jgi:hypothetical protein